MRELFAMVLFGMSLATFGCGSSSATQPVVKVGAKVLLEEHLSELEGKRVGLVMNPTARVDGTHMLDTLLSRGINVTALFAPEHGFRGDLGAGETIQNGLDQTTGLPVYSLYGETKKPTAKMLDKVNVLLFDMQDVGARFYTYNVTLGNILEAGAENKVPVWVLDRPNPAGGDFISGWMLQEQHKSFVGAYPIPMVHGMTLGELAKMIVGEHWIDHAEQCSLRVISMKGWKRTMKWQDTGLEWVPPSPNLPAFENAYIYLGTVLFEGSTITEGRGTSEPFLTIGSPDIAITTNQIEKLRREFNGVSFERKTFRPKSIPGKARHPKFEGELCKGVQIQLTDSYQFNPVKLGARLLHTMLEASSNDSITSFIEKLSGIDSDTLLKQIKGETYEEVWNQTAQKFAKKRSSYLLYD